MAKRSSAGASSVEKLMKAMECQWQSATPQQPMRWLTDPSQYVNPERFGELNKLPNGIPLDYRRFKTVICRPWLVNGRCPYGEKCTFAHGDQELRPMPFKNPMARHPKYKTLPCKNYTKAGICSYGFACLFVHKSAAEDIAALAAQQAELARTQKQREWKMMAMSVFKTPPRDFETMNAKGDRSTDIFVSPASDRVERSSLPQLSKEQQMLKWAEETRLEMQAMWARSGFL